MFKRLAAQRLLASTARVAAPRRFFANFGIGPENHAYSDSSEQRLWGQPPLPEGESYPNQGWEVGYFIFAVLTPLYAYILGNYGPSIDIYDWAREEVLLTEDTTSGRPMTEIYPDYDVTADSVKRYN